MNIYGVGLMALLAIALFFYHREESKKKKYTVEDYLKNASRKGRN